MPVSIFNDVIGPVMRGPSSSHVAAAYRMGRLVRNSLTGEPTRVRVEFDIRGSLAKTYHGHGTDFGFAGGLLEIELTDERVTRSLEIAHAQKVDLEYKVLDLGEHHPNYYRITAEDSNGVTRHWEGISTGGGMIRMTSCDGFPVEILGDYFELLIQAGDGNMIERAQKILPGEKCTVSKASNGQILADFKLIKRPSPDAWTALAEIIPTDKLMLLAPVLPTPAKPDCTLPFETAAELLDYAQANSLPLWRCALQYESACGTLDEDEVFDKMHQIIIVLRSAIQRGLKGTVYEDRILGPQAAAFAACDAENRLLPLGALNRVIAYITAIMENKSAMGVIVAAPTAGSCGCLPGTVLGVSDELGLEPERAVWGMLAAGLVGVLIVRGASFAAEVAGCQAECGAGSAMAAAAVVQMLGGSVDACLDAASMALQSVTGLACDPVAGRVEVPCLGKNVMAGANAVSAANMALAGFDKVIPLDESIWAMRRVGELLPSELRCTLGGLGETPTSQAIQKRLK